MDAGGAPVVRVRGLSKTFTRSGGEVLKVIDDVSFDIPAGEFTVLLGPSGCGKTTLLRTIAGLERPDEGSIDLRGRPAFDAARGVNVPPERRNVSMVFQSYALWPHMTVFDNVAYPLRMRGGRTSKTEVGDRVQRVLALVGIPTLGGQYPNSLSGGQQQRVALARALVDGSDLVLFDEPLSNVDAKVREQLRIELIEMQAALGFSAVFVTHDQTEAMILADRIAVLDRGVIVQFGAPEHVYAEPVSRYVANFIGSTNELVGVLAGIDAAGHAVVDTPLGPVTGVPGVPELAEGAEVVAVWRPELCELSTDEPAAGNRWRGMLKATLFLGSHTEYVVSVDEHAFRVWSAQRRAVRAANDDVWLAAPVDSVRILPMEPLQDAAH